MEIRPNTITFSMEAFQFENLLNTMYEAFTTEEYTSRYKSFKAFILEHEEAIRMFEHSDTRHGSAFIANLRESFEF